MINDSKVIAIAAVSENGIIGSDGSIPWHIPEEFKWFKKATMGGNLVMGRKTWDSIGRPLPGRTTIVVSRLVPYIQGITVINDLDTLRAFKFTSDIFICGGAEIYKQAFPLCDELLLTTVKQTVKGDTVFPDYQIYFNHSEVVMDHELFTVNRWIKK